MEETEYRRKWGRRERSMVVVGWEVFRESSGILWHAVLSRLGKSKEKTCCSHKLLHLLPLQQKAHPLCDSVAEGSHVVIGKKVEWEDTCGISNYWLKRDSLAWAYMLSLFLWVGIVTIATTPGGKYWGATTLGASTELLSVWVPGWPCRSNHQSGMLFFFQNSYRRNTSLLIIIVKPWLIAEAFIIATKRCRWKWNLYHPPRLHERFTFQILWGKLPPLWDVCVWWDGQYLAHNSM